MSISTASVLKTLSNQQLIAYMQDSHDAHITGTAKNRIVFKELQAKNMRLANQERITRGMHLVRLTDPTLIKEKLDKKQQLIEDSFNEPSIIGQAVDVPKDIQELEAMQRLVHLFSL